MESGSAPVPVPTLLSPQPCFWGWLVLQSNNSENDCPSNAAGIPVHSPYAAVPQTSALLKKGYLGSTDLELLTTATAPLVMGLLCASPLLGPYLTYRVCSATSRSKDDHFPHRSQWETEAQRR